jgi:predicted anti-sigma-YlaC factor YlaD
MTGGSMSGDSMAGGSMDHDFCTWLFHHLSEYVDAEFQKEICTQVEVHMLECPSCRALVHTMRGTMEIVQEGSAQCIPPACLQRIRERVLKGRESA